MASSLTSVLQPLPGRPRIYLPEQPEKVKETAPTPPGVAVPAIACRRVWEYLERGMMILSITVMPAKGATTYPTLIQQDVAANHSQRVLLQAPGQDRTAPSW